MQEAEFSGEKLNGKWPEELSSWSKDIHQSSGLRERMTQEEYKEAVEKSARHIVEVLGINNRVFETPVRSEAFFALADVLTENDLLPDGDEKTAERIFLTNIAKTLAGRDSQVLRRSADAGDALSKEYVNAEDAESNKEVREKINRLFAREAKEEGMRVAEVLNSHEEIRRVQREYGISPNEQHLFRLLVVDASEDVGWDEDRQGRIPSEWDRLAGDREAQAPKAFVQFLPNGETYLVISKQTANDFLNGGTNADVVTHEYMHTQRSFRVAERFGNIFDEVAIGSAARDTSHYSSRLFSILLSDCLKAAGHKSLTPALRESMNADDHGASFYRYFAEKFGPRALLYVLAARPSAYEMSETIPQIPKFRTNGNERMSDLLAFVLSEAEDRMPGFKDGLQNALQDKDYADFLSFAPDGFGLALPVVWREMIAAARQQGSDQKF